MFTVMVIDDSPFIVDIFVTMLQRGGYQTVAAYGGQEALDTLSNVKPDLILLDIMMPNIDGFTTLKKIRSNKDYRNIKIILLSAKTGEADIRKGTELGADAYITKPYSIKKLTEKVEELLSENPL